MTFIRLDGSEGYSPAHGLGIEQARSSFVILFWGDSRAERLQYLVPYWPGRIDRISNHFNERERIKVPRGLDNSNLIWRVISSNKYDLSCIGSDRTEQSWAH